MASVANLHLRFQVPIRDAEDAEDSTGTLLTADEPPRPSHMPNEGLEFE